MDISKTLIGTADVPTISGGVNLYQYVHFPDDWSDRVAFTAWDAGTDFDIKILEGKIASRAAFAIEYGLAGPAWGGRMFVEGTATASEIRLDVQEDDFKAGMLLGVAFSPQLALNIQSYTITPNPSWRHPFRFKTEWHNVCDISIDESFDLVGFLYNQIVKPWLIDGIKDLEDEIPLAVLNLLVNLFSFGASPNLIASNNGITDHVDDTPLVDLAVVDWAWEGLVMSPDLKIEWDLVDVAVSLGETVGLIPPLTAFGEAITIIDKLTKWLRPKVTSGPVVGIELNVHLKISGLTAYVDDANGNPTATVTTKNVRGEGSSIVADIDSGGEHIDAINRLGVEFVHRAGVTFEVGWHTGISWLKIFSHDFIKTMDPTDLINVAEIPISEQYLYRLSSPIGNTSNASEKVLVDSWIFSP